MGLRQVYYKLKHKLREPSLILMYHRIAAPETDAWHLAVSPENFEQQLKVLQKNYKVVSLQALYKQYFLRPFQKKCIAITFDDGYLDNFLVAGPLLEKYKMPATFFVTSKNIGSERYFWWDELEYIILQSQELPPFLNIDIAGEPFSFNLEAEKLLTGEMRKKHRNYDAFEPVTLRGALYLELWKKMSPLLADEQERVLERIREWAGIKPASGKNYTCMSEKHLKELAGKSLFSIGGHTLSHPALSFHNKETQLREIKGNKEYLEGLCGRKVEMFAYPSGSFNNETINVLKELGIKAAVTTQPELVRRQTDPYLLGRIHADNRSGEKFEKLLSDWFWH